VKLSVSRISPLPNDDVEPVERRRRRDHRRGDRVPSGRGQTL